jgi:hypothetical protein
MKWNWIAQSENYLAIETDHPSSVPTGAGFFCPNRIPNSKTANVFLAVKRQKPEAESFLSLDEFQTASRFALRRLSTFVLRCGFYQNAFRHGGYSLMLDVSRSHSYTSQSVGILWTRDRPVAEIST